MTQIVVTEEQAKQIEAADGPVNVVDATGAVIAVCRPMKYAHSPYSPEEVERRRKELEAVRAEAREHPERCKTTAEVLEYLRQLGEERK